MTLKALFPVSKQFKSLFFSEPSVLIEKDLREEALNMGSEKFYIIMQDIKAGKSVKIGDKTYSKHNVISTKHVKDDQDRASKDF